MNHPPFWRSTYKSFFEKSGEVNSVDLTRPAGVNTFKNGWVGETKKIEQF